MFKRLAPWGFAVICLLIGLTSILGGIVNDPVMLRLGENHFWFALASSDALLYAMGLAANLDWDVQLGEPDVSPVARREVSLERPPPWRSRSSSRRRRGPPPAVRGERGA